MNCCPFTLICSQNGKYMDPGSINNHQPLVIYGSQTLHLHLRHHRLHIICILPHEGLVKVINDSDRDQNSISTTNSAEVIRHDGQQPYAHPSQRRGNEDITSQNGCRGGITMSLMTT